MKKILLTLVCVFGMSTVASALTSSAVLLQHNGNITTYAAEDIAKAMAAAADGDEVFLNEGIYPGFTISSAIKIKGMGEMTIIDGDIVIQNTNESKIGSIYIGYVDVKGNLKGLSEIGKLILSQCKMYEYKQDGAIVDDVYIDRCNMKILLSNNYGNNINKLLVKNSIIGSTGYYDTSYTTYPSFTFVNCDLSVEMARGFAVINSILRVQYWIKDSEFINTATKYISSENKYTGCYDELLDYSKMTQDDIIANGHVGNDGTAIGPLGGTTPFTLVPTVPRVTESSLKVDPQKKELNVTVTVTPK